MTVRQFSAESDILYHLKTAVFCPSKNSNYYTQHCGLCKGATVTRQSSHMQKNKPINPWATSKNKNCKWRNAYDRDHGSSLPTPTQNLKILGVLSGVAIQTGDNRGTSPRLDGIAQPSILWLHSSKDIFFLMFSCFSFFLCRHQNHNISLKNVEKVSHFTIPFEQFQIWPLKDTSQHFSFFGPWVANFAA